MGANSMQSFQLCNVTLHYCKFDAVMLKQCVRTVLPITLAKFCGTNTISCTLFLMEVNLLGNIGADF